MGFEWRLGGEGGGHGGSGHVIPPASAPTHPSQLPHPPSRRGDRRSQQELSWAKRLDMLRDVAAGMVFLHSRRPPVIHGDLRSPNLLLDLSFDRDRPRFHVKIADFGLAVSGWGLYPGFGLAVRG